MAGEESRTDNTVIQILWELIRNQKGITIDTTMTKIGRLVA